MDRLIVKGAAGMYHVSIKGMLISTARGVTKQLILLI